MARILQQNVCEWGNFNKFTITETTLKPRDTLRINYSFNFVFVIVLKQRSRCLLTINIPTEKQITCFKKIRRLEIFLRTHNDMIIGIIYVKWGFELSVTTDTVDVTIDVECSSCGIISLIIRTYPKHSLGIILNLFWNVWEK